MGYQKLFLPLETGVSGGKGCKRLSSDVSDHHLEYHATSYLTSSNFRVEVQKDLHLNVVHFGYQSKSL